MRLRLVNLLVLAGLAATPASNAIQQPQLPVAVCVVAPRVEPVEEADALGIVPVDRPRLVVVEPLLELRIARARATTWRLVGSPGEPIRTPLDWPTAPILPGELVLLQLRPQDAPVDAFAHVHLVGAATGRMESSRRLIEGLPGSGPAWISAIDTALRAGDVPLAWSLLFAPQAPADADLAALQEEVVRRGCGG
ncbi:hypothetical protein CPCC7001_925 [Cyanobium sp. PCC 7001]|uniref:hypothetical protein n=1 Tax=Cyanobium sp. PCC 7001 TaxID=180281 RepID=UPI0001805286|nr:hypothetical protein [Cyanobium sp. PCC 7001]EDY38046.1 hypothetical protein CPCC7001_925 [Cyanobium sp. PCC 7001]